MKFRLSLLFVIILAESCFACIEPPHDTTHPNDPQNPSQVTRGLTNYNDASYLNGRLESVPITINTAVTDPPAITEVIAHEIGHTGGRTSLEINFAIEEGSM